ncbi:hypothetical protein ACHAPU_006098 [Fusarium lateritium]
MDSSIEPITDIYWPVFKREVEADEAKVRPIRLTCIVCYDLMTTSPSEGPHRLNDSSIHAAQILPCGHMIGVRCWVEWIAHLALINGRWTHHKCPGCNIKLPRHERCGHSPSGRLIPASVDQYSSIPRVLSEGGRVGTRCAKCELQNALRMLREASETFDPDLGRGEYLNMALRIDDLFLCFMEPRNPQQRLQPKVVRELEIPSDVAGLWEVINLTWRLNSCEHWDNIDLGEVNLAVCVFQSQPSSQAAEDLAHFDGDM